MHLILCESTGDWAAALRRRLPPGMSVVETRSLDELAERLDIQPSATVAIEWNAARGEMLLTEIARLGRRYPAAVVMILADRELASWESAVREAGAAHFVVSRRAVVEVIDIARHRVQSGRWTSLAPAQTGNLEDRLMNELPWANSQAST